MDLRVECRSDDGGRVPRRFGRPGAMHDVSAVLDRWPGNEITYYRVRTPDGVEYILRCDERDGSWRIQFLEARGAHAGDR